MQETLHDHHTSISIDEQQHIRNGSQHRKDQDQDFHHEQHPCKTDFLQPITAADRLGLNKLEAGPSAQPGKRQPQKLLKAQIPTH